MELLQIKEMLVQELGRLKFTSPVVHVYNPLVYAAGSHDTYLNRYGRGRKEALFMGMNPGPWGMAQTGIPFGEVNVVREWLKISFDVGKPAQEHPRKLVEGFSCRRSEVSGRRLWGLFRSRMTDAEQFFDRFFVLNYCPLLFLDTAGRFLADDVGGAALAELDLPGDEIGVVRQAEPVLFDAHELAGAKQLADLVGKSTALALGQAKAACDLRFRERNVVGGTKQG